MNKPTDVCALNDNVPLAVDVFAIDDRVRILCNESKFKGTIGKVYSFNNNRADVIDDQGFIIGSFLRASSLELI